MRDLSFYQQSQNCWLWNSLYFYQVKPTNRVVKYFLSTKEVKDSNGNGAHCVLCNLGIKMQASDVVLTWT